MEEVKEKRKHMTEMEKKQGFCKTDKVRNEL